MSVNSIGAGLVFLYGLLVYPEGLASDESSTTCPRDRDGRHHPAPDHADLVDVALTLTSNVD